MILADTSIWIDHFRLGDALLIEHLKASKIVTHAYVISEIALGTLNKLSAILMSLDDLPQVPVATDHEVRHLIESQRLFGRGIGYVDAHLIASVRLSPGTLLWTRDKRLKAVLNELNLSSDLV